MFERNPTHIAAGLLLYPAVKFNTISLNITRLVPPQQLPKSPASASNDCMMRVVFSFRRRIANINDIIHDNALDGRRRIRDLGRMVYRVVRSRLGELDDAD